MAAIIKFLCVILVFISLTVGGNCQCSISNIKIAQSKTGALVQNKPEWSVTIKNDCVCSQLNLQLDCKGYQTVKQADPSVLSVSGGRCLVNNGQPIFGFKTISFTYAWDSAFPFHPVSSTLACSRAF